MSFRRIIKDSLISLAVLGMVGGSLDNNVANAKHRRHHYRYTRQIKRAKHYRKRGKSYRHHHMPKHYRRNGHKRRKAKKVNKGQKHNLAKKKEARHKKAIISKIKAKESKEKEARKRARQLAEYPGEEINLINQDRAQHGKAPLTESSRLDAIAHMGAERMANGDAFAHVDTNGDPYSSEDAYKLGYISSPSEDLFGENIDAGDATPKDANNSLYTNEASHDGGHYQNIISEYPNEDYNEVGVGVATNPNSEYGIYWVEDFNNTNNDNDFNDNSSTNSNDSDPTDNDSSDADTDNDNESQSQSSYNYNSNNNNNGSSSSISESSDDGSNNININNNNNNTTSSNSDNDSYVNPLAGKTIHKNGVTVTYTKDGMIARDNNGDTSSASGPNSTINIDGQTFTD